MVIASVIPARGADFASLTTVSAGITKVARLQIPGAMGIAFSSRKPQAYVSTRGNTKDTLVVIDIANPLEPKIVNSVGLSDVGLEDVNLAERPDGTAFVLLGPGPLGGEKGLTVVDVSNVTNTNRPQVLASMPDVSHTWTCVGQECRYAYATGSTRADGSHDFSRFAVLNLTNPSNPEVATSHPSLVSGRSITHDWNYDEAGVMWALGHNGIAAYDVGNPTTPKALNTSDKNGEFLHSQYNDRSQLHGSLRPNARRFRPDSAASAASLDNGDVLLVSEEGNDHDCSDSFQTWHVPHLDAKRLVDPVQPNGGTIAPLDNWSLLSHTTPGIDRPADPDFCSVHWFDYHQEGFVVMAAYGAGTRMLDVRNPGDIHEVGYHYTSADAANHSYWVPERDKQGRTTGRATNIVYTADVGSTYVTGLGNVAVIGGIDIFLWEGKKK